MTSFILDSNFEWQSKKCAFKLYSLTDGQKPKKIGEKNHNLAQYIGKFDDEPTELHITNNISFKFNCQMTIADPQVHKDLFLAANAIEDKASTSNDLVLKNLSVMNDSIMN